MIFREKLLEASRKNESWLCIGLDPDTAKLPDISGSGPEAVLKFNRAVIESTTDLVCAYKPNAAFYECMGAAGLEILKETIKSIPDHIPVILDFKRGDIGNTAAMYARSAFENLRADAVTVNPYLGRDSIEPFVNYREKGTFVLCLTSNPSSSDIQRQLMLLEDPPEGGRMPPQSKAKKFAEFFKSSTQPLYSYIAGLAVEWNGHGNVGLVVGATSHKELKQIRETIGENMPILIPGVGAQGGDLERSVIYGSNSNGEMAIINVARGIIYAWRDESLFQSEVRDAAESFKRQITEAAAGKMGSKR